MTEIVFEPDKCVGYINDPNLVESLDKRWFGKKEGNILVLTLEEIAYLMLKQGYEVVVGEKKYTCLEELMEKFYDCFKTMFWPRLLVYNDLRSRGRRVKTIGENKFLVKHKDGTLKLVVVLEEKRLISGGELLDLARQARSNDLGLILAIVSLQGDLTYYEVVGTDLRK